MYRCSESLEYDSILLVYEIFITTPSHYTTQSLTQYPWQKTSEIANCTLSFIYFHCSVCNPSIVLGLVFVVELEVGPRSNQVKRMCHYTAHYICAKRCQWCHNGQVQCPTPSVPIQSKQKRVVCLEAVVNRVEDSWKGDITDKRDLESCEETTHAFFLNDLSECIACAIVLTEAHHLKACLYHYEWIWNYRLEDAGAWAG